MIPKREEVEDLPDAMSDQERQLDVLFTGWLARKGISADAFLNRGETDKPAAEPSVESEEMNDDDEGSYDLTSDIDTPLVDPEDEESIEPLQTKVVQAEGESSARETDDSLESSEEGAEAPQDAPER